MGLGFSPGNAHWSYSGFHRFRKRLANEIGIELNDMIGFGGTKEWELIKDPISLLLDHSDCEGALKPIECEQIYPRLEEIVSGWDDNDYDKKMALVFVEDLKLCSDEDITMRFC